MTLNDETKITELEHTTNVQRSTTSENTRKRWGPMVCWNPTETKSS